MSQFEFLKSEFSPVFSHAEKADPSLQPRAFREEL